MKVKELLADPERWTIGTFARDEAGLDVNSNAPNARCWCLMGAVYHCYSSYAERVRVMRKLEDDIEKQFGLSNIPDFNDTASHEEMDVLERTDV